MAEVLAGPFDGKWYFDEERMVAEYPELVKDKDEWARLKDIMRRSSFEVDIAGGRLVEILEGSGSYSVPSNINVVSQSADSVTVQDEAGDVAILTITGPEQIQLEFKGDQKIKTLYLTK